MIHEFIFMIICYYSFFVSHSFIGTPTEQTWINVINVLRTQIQKNVTFDNWIQLQAFDHIEEKDLIQDNRSLWYM